MFLIDISKAKAFWVALLVSFSVVVWKICGSFVSRVQNPQGLTVHINVHVALLSNCTLWDVTLQQR